MYGQPIGSIIKPNVPSAPRMPRAPKMPKPSPADPGVVAPSMPDVRPGNREVVKRRIRQSLRSAGLETLNDGRIDTSDNFLIYHVDIAGVSSGVAYRQALDGSFDVDEAAAQPVIRQVAEAMKRVGLTPEDIRFSQWSRSDSDAVEIRVVVPRPRPAAPEATPPADWEKFGPADYDYVRTRPSPSMYEAGRAWDDDDAWFDSEAAAELATAAHEPPDRDDDGNLLHPEDYSPADMVISFRGAGRGVWFKDGDAHVLIRDDGAYVTVHPDPENTGFWFVDAVGLDMSMVDGVGDGLEDGKRVAQELLAGLPRRDVANPSPSAAPAEDLSRLPGADQVDLGAMRVESEHRVQVGDFVRTEDGFVQISEVYDRPRDGRRVIYGANSRPVPPTRYRDERGWDGRLHSRAEYEVYEPAPYPPGTPLPTPTPTNALRIMKTVREALKAARLDRTQATTGAELRGWTDSLGSTGFSIRDGGDYWDMHVVVDGKAAGLRYDERFRYDAAGDLVDDYEPIEPEKLLPRVKKVIRSLGLRPSKARATGWSTSWDYDVGFNLHIPKTSWVDAGTVEEKARVTRRVRTPEGARIYGQPIGTVIRLDAIPEGPGRRRGRAATKPKPRPRGARTTAPARPRPSKPDKDPGPAPATRDVPTKDPLNRIRIDGRPNGEGTVEDPIDVGGDLDRALREIAEGRHVRLRQVDEVATLLDRMLEEVDAAKNAGDAEPHFDLAKVSVPGTNLFAQESRGVPRLEMPQLSGYPQPGSPASRLQANAGEKVDLGPPLKAELAEMGIDVERRRMPASHLRATQAELSGAAVASIAAGYEDGSITDAPIFVTRDGYVLDGHHRWAAKVSADARDGKLDDVEMDVDVIDLDIGAALDFVSAYTEKMGISGRPLGVRSEEARPTPYPQVDDAITARGDHPMRPMPAGEYPYGDPRNDPEYAEYLRRVDARVAESISTDATHVRHAQTLPNGQLIWSAERAQMHDDIVSKILDQVEAEKKVPRDHRAWIVGGLAGAGKSTYLQEHGADMGLKMEVDEASGDVTPANAITINPDDMKSLLFEMRDAEGNPVVPTVEGLTRGEMAGHVHEESSTLAKLLATRALAQGYNVVFDVTVASEKSTLKSYLAPARDAGYDIEGAFIDVDLATSLHRAGLRHKAINRETHERTFSGRYVPYDFMYASEPPEGALLPDGTRPRTTNRMSWDSLVRNGYIDRDRVIESGLPRPQETT